LPVKGKDFEQVHLSWFQRSLSNRLQLHLNKSVIVSKIDQHRINCALASPYS